MPNGRAQTLRSEGTRHARPRGRCWQFSHDAPPLSLAERTTLRRFSRSGGRNPGRAGARLDVQTLLQGEEIDMFGGADLAPT